MDHKYIYTVEYGQLHSQFDKPFYAVGRRLLGTDIWARDSWVQKP